MTKMQTHSGAIIDFHGTLRGEKQPWRVTDIAHGLSHANRYAGHTLRAYNVAEHSLLVYRLAVELYPEYPLIQGAALFHDAHEAYTGDMINPLKGALPGAAQDLKILQDAIDVGLEAMFRWPRGAFANPCVKYCDSAVYAYESLRVRKIESPFVVAERIRLHETGCDHWPEGMIEFMEPYVAKGRFLLAAARALAAIRDAGLGTLPDVDDEGNPL